MALEDLRFHVVREADRRAAQLSGRSTAACTKSNTTTSKRSAASACSTAETAAGVRSAATLTGKAESRSGARCQREERDGLGCQPMKRSHCRSSSGCHSRCCSCVAGDSSVRSKRRFPSIRAGYCPYGSCPGVRRNRNTGEMNATFSLLTSRCLRTAQIQPRAGRVAIQVDHSRLWRAQ